MAVRGGSNPSASASGNDVANASNLCGCGGAAVEANGWRRQRGGVWWLYLERRPMALNINDQSGGYRRRRTENNEMAVICGVIDVFVSKNGGEDWSSIWPYRGVKAWRP
jgi:hypothetical protein